MFRRVPVNGPGFRFDFPGEELVVAGVFLLRELRHINAVFADEGFDENAGKTGGEKCVIEVEW